MSELQKGAACHASSTLHRFRCIFLFVDCSAPLSRPPRRQLKGKGEGMNGRTMNVQLGGGEPTEHVLIVKGEMAFL